jgi:predicted patatin/cPLA2 family phospholipase
VETHRLTTVLAERAAQGSQPGARSDGHRVVLAIEGGGMRGTVSAGMALAVQELGLLPLFDAVYGASAGAISSTWLLSSRPEGLRGWTDPAFAKALIRKRNLLRGRPIVDVEQLIEVVYRHEFPLDFASVLANPIELHPLATDIATGASVDLHDALVDEATLRLAMRASAALPLLAGGPVPVGGRRFLDAGVAESIPFRQALRDGATHVLVLRSRQAVFDAAPTEPSRQERLVAQIGLRRHTPQFRATFLARAARLFDDEHLLSDHEVADISGISDSAGPAVLSIRPHASTPHVGRLATDGDLLHRAFEAGREAVTTRLAVL